MFVSDVLMQKGGLVFTVTPGTSVAQAAAQLSTRRIGALVVLGKNDDVVGIVSERDVVRALAKDGESALGHDVADIMTRDVQTCDPDDSINEVMAAMTGRAFDTYPLCATVNFYG